MGRESMNLRGQVFELDSSGKAGTDGLPSAVTIRGVTPQGDAAETFTISSGTAAWKSPVDAGTASYSAPSVLRVARRTDRHDGVVPRSAAGKARQVARAPARRQSTRGQAGRSRSRRRRGKTDDHALGDHRHRHLAAAALGGREQQVLRLDVRNRVAARGVCRRAVEDRGGAGEGDGGAGSGAGQVAGEGACGAGGVHGCPALRRRRDAVPDRPDGGRRQGRDHRGRRSRVGHGARRRAGRSTGAARP